MNKDPDNTHDTTRRGGQGDKELFKGTHNKLHSVATGVTATAII